MSRALVRYVLIRSDPAENHRRVPEPLRELASRKVQREYVELARQVIRKRGEQERLGIRGPNGLRVHRPVESVNER